MTPNNAKKLMRALIDNVQKYEQVMGVISEEEIPGTPPMNFGTPTTQA